MVTQADSSTSTPWVRQDPTMFEFRHYDQEMKNKVYRLNVEKICQKDFHLFFPIKPCEELLISTALEFLTFHPLDKKMNEKFNIGIVKCEKIELFWCSFPKEFKEVCEKVSKTFEMTMKNMSRAMIYGSKNDILKFLKNPKEESIGLKESAIENDPGTTIEFPSAENILCFQGNRCDNPDLILKQCDDITRLGNSIHNLGID